MRGFGELIQDRVAPTVIGNRVFNFELIWEKLFRSTDNMAARIRVEAISAIDNALWDILGKTLGQPLLNLLGGRTRSNLRGYASQRHAMDDLHALRAEAKRYAAAGFTA